MDGYRHASTCSLPGESTGSKQPGRHPSEQENGLCSLSSDKSQAVDYTGFPNVAIKPNRGVFSVKKERIVLPISFLLKGVVRQLLSLLRFRPQKL